MRYACTALPEGSRLVRFLPGDDPAYDRMTVAVEHDEGRTLHLLGWIGEPLTPAQWRAAKAALFPAAETVRFERWCQTTRSFRAAELTVRIPSSPRKEIEA